MIFKSYYVRILCVTVQRLAHLTQYIYFNPSNAEATYVQTQGSRDFCKPSKPCHVCIHKIALTEYAQMSTNIPGFQSFFTIFASFYTGKISHHQHKGYKFISLSALPIGEYLL